MPSRARARLAAVGVTAAAALALPLTAVAGQAAPTPVTAAVGSGVGPDDPAALSRAVLAAALEAQELQAQAAPMSTLAAPDESARAGATPDGGKPGTPAPGKPGPSKPEPAKPGKPGPGRPGPGIPDPRAQALDDAVRALVADGALAVTARVETPDLRWAQAAGKRELGRPAPARVDDAYRIGSITKTFVATLVLQEVERGTWTLGTRVEDVLPGLLPGHPEVTIEHLLSHRSGMPTGTDTLLLSRIEDPESIEDQVAALGEEYTQADHVAAALATPWLFEPGTDWSYSNAGYVVLGLLLEEVTGQDLAHLLRHRVLRPAGLRHTDLPDQPRAHGPFLVEAMYTGEYGAGWYSLPDLDPSVFGAAGAATSTTADLLRFGDSLLGGRLLRASTVADMATPRTPEPIDYGLGLYRVPDPCAPAGSGAYLYGHDGVTFGTLSLALSSPDGERSFAVGVTGRDLSGSEVPLYDLNELLVPVFLATCSATS